MKNEIKLKNKSFDIQNNECYLISQKKYAGKNYDILIIQNINNKINAIFVQIGVNKTISEIQNIKTDLVLNINKYKMNLKFSFGFNIDSFYLTFIFDEETQKAINPKKLSGAKICFDNNIDFLVYSFKDCSLKKTDNLVDYNSALYFIPKYEINEKSSYKLK